MPFSTTIVIVTATPSATSEPHYAKSTMTTFVAVVCGVTGFCILFAVALLFWWRRKRWAKNARTSIDHEKDPADGWLPRHAERPSDGGLPLLMNDARSSLDALGRKPHYRLASERRSLQPADYVLELYRPEDDIDDGDDEMKKYLVPSFTSPFPSLMSKGFFMVQPEDPSHVRYDSSEMIANTNGPTVTVQAQVAAAQNMTARHSDPASPRQNLKCAVSRSSTLSAMSVYSQSTISSPQQDSDTPSLSAFPLPPPMSIPSHLVSPTKIERDDTMLPSPNSDIAIINYLVRDKPRVPLRSPQRPGSRMSTIVEPRDEP
ncbi:hypothetical protein F5887DRAFT_1074567 [Amanita rubescens]|nr:hypothetical protein F5887DRAFT_1074567 [Amanita rubescens]